MPLEQRIISPVHVCRGAIPTDDHGQPLAQVANDLECVTNGTLANIIRQLSSLSKHADDLFGALFIEASTHVNRTNELQKRVERLAVRVTKLDSTVEEVSLQNATQRKAFKSTIQYDQQVVARESMPAAMKDMYNNCDPPPPLDNLNCYRDDGKDGLKFYTDPKYFFELWRQEMLRDTQKIKQDKVGRKSTTQDRDGRKSSSKKIRQPLSTQDRMREKVPQHEISNQSKYQHPDPHFPANLPPPVEIYGVPNISAGPPTPALPPPQQADQPSYFPSPPNGSPPHVQQQQVHPPPPISMTVSPPLHHLHHHPQQSVSIGTGATQMIPNGVPPPPSLSGPNFSPSRPNIAPPAPPALATPSTPTRRPSLPPPPPPEAEDLPPPPPPTPPPMPPPPPPLPTVNGDLNGPPKPPAPPATNGILPPPPPPAPPISLPLGGPTLTQSINEVRLKPVTAKASPVTDARSDLLQAIREGIKLRRVEDNKAKEVEKNGQPCDVASILARRVAIEYSDSEESNDSDDGSEWGNTETDC